MAKGNRKPIANSTKARATEELGTVFVDLRGPKSTHSLRALGIIQNAALGARIQAPILVPHVVLAPSETLWAEAVHWACEVLNGTVTTSNPDNKSPHQMWDDKAAPALQHPFLRPGYCR